MEQLSIFQNEKNIKVCAFTGHRELPKDFSKKKLKQAVISMIEKGADTFLCGMALGFDLLAAETVLTLKKKYPSIRLVACIPCLDQNKYYSKIDNKRYEKALDKADERAVLAERYFNGCMHQRNKYMAERADALIAYCKKDSGGTYYTVKTFKKLCPEGEILFL